MLHYQGNEGEASGHQQEEAEAGQADDHRDEEYQGAASREGQAADPRHSGGGGGSGGIQVDTMGPHIH